MSAATQDAADAAIVFDDDCAPFAVPPLEDIAWTLAQLPRWAATQKGDSVSVAEHCVLGAQLLIKNGHEDAALAFLMHDAHEACGLGDITVGAVNAIQAELTKRVDMLLHDDIDQIALRPLIMRIKIRQDAQICKRVPGLSVGALWQGRDLRAAGYQELAVHQTAANGHTAAIIAIADEIMAGIEGAALFRSQPFEAPSPWSFEGIAIKRWPPLRAEEEWRAMYERLTGQILPRRAS